MKKLETIFTEKTTGKLYRIININNDIVEVKEVDKHGNPINNMIGYCDLNYIKRNWIKYEM